MDSIDCINSGNPDWIYLSGARVARNEVALAAAGITEIFTCLPVPQMWPNCIHRYTSSRFEDDEHEDLVEHIKCFLDAVDRCRARGGKLLVHCQAGMSRSPSLVIAYLMLRHNMTLAAARAYVYQRRGAIHPNDGFITQLQELQRRIDAGEPPLDRHLIVSKCDQPLWLSYERLGRLVRGATPRLGRLTPLSFGRNSGP